jgi:tRNA1(Val) A37 N6-methylase TrmN6
MNLYEGDTLEMDIESVWNIDKFDVVVNPPYNTELKQQVRRLYTTCLLNVILINVIICLL